MRKNTLADKRVDISKSERTEGLISHRKLKRATVCSHWSSCCSKGCNPSFLRLSTFKIFPNALQALFCNALVKTFLPAKSIYQLHFVPSLELLMHLSCLPLLILPNILECPPSSWLPILRFRYLAKCQIVSYAFGVKFNDTIKVLFRSLHINSSLLIPLLVNAKTYTVLRGRRLEFISLNFTLSLHI